MSCPDHPTFQPGGYAWALGDDYIRHTVNGRLEAATRAYNAMTREMRRHGADDDDIDAWLGSLDGQINHNPPSQEWFDGPNGPETEEYISITGHYPLTSDDVFVTQP